MLSMILLQVAAKMKIREIRTKVIKCPPSILANNRIIKAIGLVNTPKISMTGIIGTGHFNQVGTSGQKISFQYPLRPEKLTSTVIAVVFAVFMGFIDLLICFIQAYVFMLLSAIFISLARPAETGARHEK